MTKNKPKPDFSGMGRTMKRLLSYLTGKYRGQFILVLVCIVMTSVATVSTALFMEVLIDDHITPMINGTGGSFAELAKAILKLAVILGMGVLAVFLQNRLMVTIAQDIQKRIRDELFAHMQTLPLSYFDSHSNGDVMSYYTNDIDALRQLLSQSIPNLISSLITIVTVFASMIYTSIWLTMAEIVGIFLMLLAMKHIAGKSGKYFMGYQQSIAEVDGYIEEMINGQKVVKVFCHEDAAKEGFDKVNDELTENFAKAHTYANILMPVMGNIGNILYVSMGLIGGVLALSGVGGLTVGAIATFIQLTKSFTMPVAQIGQQANFVIMGMAGASRIFTLMDEQPETDCGDVTLVNLAYDKDGNMQESPVHTGEWAWKVPEGEGFRYQKLCGDVRFHQVNFSYVKEKQILHDIELYAHPGHKIAFVGATGAGKTTVTNLINRFYDVQEGEITYDGIDVKRIKKRDLRNSLGMVLQDVHLFTGTVRDNIRYGRLDATDEEVVEAAKLANAHDFISRLPDGYDTMLKGDGGRLSQGQRQLISIARAAISQPPVMILDEATSSIDTRTEALVQAGMDGLMKGRTVFVIAHRLSTVKDANVIMVMENGRIIERGTHEYLLEQKGNYWKLYTGGLHEQDLN